MIHIVNPFYLLKKSQGPNLVTCQDDFAFLTTCTSIKIESMDPRHPSKTLTRFFGATLCRSAHVPRLTGDHQGFELQAQIVEAQLSQLGDPEQIRLDAPRGATTSDSPSHRLVFMEPPKRPQHKEEQTSTQIHWWDFPVTSLLHVYSRHNLCSPVDDTRASPRPLRLPVHRPGASPHHVQSDVCEGECATPLTGRATFRPQPHTDSDATRVAKASQLKIC